MKRWLIVAGALGLAGLSACSSGKCEPCTTCPDFAGEYYEIIELVADYCNNGDIVEGDLHVRVFNQVDSSLDVEVTDQTGAWTLFSGYLCASEQSSYPSDYAFIATYSPSQPADRIQRDYQLSGYFRLESEQATPQIYATLTITERDLDANESCQVTASISPRVTAQ